MEQQKKKVTVTKTIEKKDKPELNFSGKYFYAVGRRKTATVRVKLYPQGSGQFMVNKKDYKKYFPFVTWQQDLDQPFNIVAMENKFDVNIRAIGGGPQGQAEACRLGISRALIKYNPEFKTLLRTAGLVTRDPRAKERKKPGLKKARRAPQWSKR